MTKFMQKSFSVFNNFIKVQTCDCCGQESQVFNITVEGRLCEQCYQKNKELRLRKKLEEELTKKS